MSFETTAEVFWGFPIEAEEHTHEADVDRDKHVYVHYVGSDGDLRHYVGIVASRKVVHLGTLLRLDGMDTDPSWAYQLMAFCTRHKIAFPAEGPGWYVGPLRI